MTKDLALLVGADQKWLSTTGFLDKVDENLKKAMGVLRRSANPCHGLRDLLGHDVALGVDTSPPTRFRPCP